MALGGVQREVRLHRLRLKSHPDTNRWPRHHSTLHRHCASAALLPPLALSWLLPHLPVFFFSLFVSARPLKLCILNTFAGMVIPERLHEGSISMPMLGEEWLFFPFA